MGKRGPQPKPRALRALRGNEPAPAPVPSLVDCPDPPDWLSADARAVWDPLAADLYGRQVLTFWDGEAFAGFCDAAARRARAARHLDADGEVVDQPVFDRNGQQQGTRQVRSPWWQVWKDAAAAVQRWGARFGLSPSERDQITIKSLTPEDDLADELLTGGRWGDKPY